MLANITQCLAPQSEIQYPPKALVAPASRAVERPKSLTSPEWARVPTGIVSDVGIPLPLPSDSTY
jgi:hypothetical protein